MRRTTILSLATAGLAVLVLAGVVVAVGPHATGGGYGGGGNTETRGGYGAGDGTGTQLASRDTVLTADQAAHLKAMAEDEKLALDLYTTFADQYGDATFSAIATSEARHLSQVRTLLTRYGVTDPTAGLPAGTFATPEIQALYDQLLAQGSPSVEAAWGAGRTVEVTDIDDLDEALADDGLPRDISRVYSNLRAGSVHHLDSFEALLGA